MKHLKLLILLFPIIFFGCAKVTEGSLITAKPAENPPTSCYGTTIYNVDGTNIIYLRYVTGINSSDELSDAAPMTKATIAINGNIYINIIAGSYTHYYFYSDPNYGTQIGKVIFYDDSPSGIDLCTIKVQNNGVFDGASLITNVIRPKNTSPEIPTMNVIWMDAAILSIGNDQGRLTSPYKTFSFFSGPDVVSPLTPMGSNNFQHLYYYASTEKDGKYSVNYLQPLAKLIFRNSNSAKISLPTITIFE